ncbi:selD: selenide, water dikinase [Rubrobacter radiotolerans]|uniref:SelD: selenide, water dikinase n=1 Tax=Rubrobacter radiotolerans TaxID=42256 RepID=A0A023X2K0_RUBRA|nr:selD: selenide, water dikinase [Rubrobacter radiotolerans]
MDFFPPIVDDPYRFGQIAAANALSDIYAMGGAPLTAMNLVGFPKDLDLGVLQCILAGGMSKIEESGAQLCGGHSVEDAEPKYGLSVTGFVEQEKVARNLGARPGDALVLTKPVGFGILTTAVKRSLVTEDEIEDAIASATRLNRAAAEAMDGIGVSAATDVTGYGLAGHLSEVTRASGVGAVVRLGEVPLLDRAAELASSGCYPGGLKTNRAYLGDYVTLDGATEEQALPVFDPQTSGGLLVAVPQNNCQAYLAALEERGASGWTVGEIVRGEGIRVTS